jgi:YHS domain-containing protein
MAINRETVGLYNRICTQCGKHFEGRSEYAYKVQDKHITDKYYYFCSWKCLRAYEREHIDWKKKKEIAYQLSVGEIKEDIYEPAV